MIRLDEGAVLKVPTRPFVVERARHRFRPRATERPASTVPSSADAIRDVAQRLGNVPREATESREDMFHFLRREKGKLLVIAERVERAEQRGERPGPAPAQARPEIIRPAREGFCGRRKRPAPARDQLELLPC